MKKYTPDNIKNICIAGHSGRGKTTLAEAMLYTAKATDRLGRVADGNTVMDSDPESKKRQVTVQASVAPLEWLNKKINIIDTPGLFDFAEGLAEGMRAAGSALIVLQAGGDIDVGAEKAYKAASKTGNSIMFAITKCNSDNADFYKTYAAIQAKYGKNVCPVIVPHSEGGKVKSYVDLSVNKAYSYSNGKASEAALPDDAEIESLKDGMNEAVASADDDLMMKFFDGEKFTDEEIYEGMKKGITEGTIMPVFACDGYNCEAIDLMLNAIANFGPSAADKVEGKNNVKCDENAPLAAICFKTVADPFVGKMSYFKVISGKITSDTPAYNFRTGESERMGKIITIRGSKQEDASCISAGDIGVVTKLSGVKTGDTICDEKNPVELPGVDFPKPCLSMAVEVAKKGEDEKAASGLRKLIEEDPSITFELNEETKESILSGLGEQHLDLIVSKLKNKFGVDVSLKVPKVPYRETITKKVEVQGRHKKQSGGHGQFGDVWIRFEPCDSDDLVFAEEVFGGSVPKNYFPAIEKGLRESTLRGLTAGYPVVGVKATLYDGSYHPVDSSDMAFKTAASLAFKKLADVAGPAILEPIGTLNAYMPDDNLGDIMGDITKRRGRVLGMGPADEPGMQKLEAEVPMGEMGDFATVLRSVTQGRGSFDFTFVRYERAPENVAEKVRADYEANKEEE